MRFSELLADYLEGKSLKDVAEFCQAQGYKVDQPYLSRWRTGTRIPPKDVGAVVAIAEACGRDPEPLVLAAQLERDPTSALRQVAQLLHPFLMDATVIADEERSATEEELVNRLAEVAQVPVGALRLSLQALKASR